METLAQIIKPTQHTQYVIEAVGILLQCKKEDMPSYAVPSGSRYGPTITTLCENLEQAITTLQQFPMDKITNTMKDELFQIIEQNEYQQEDTNELVNKLKRMIDTIAQQLEQVRLYPRTSYLVAVEGSRLSYYAFQIANQLLRYGHLTVVYIDEVNEDRDCFTPDFIYSDYESYCKKLNIPERKWKIVISSNMLNRQSTATNILKKYSECQSNFIVVGAFGRSGPTVAQLGSTPPELVQNSPVPVIIVPPISICEKGTESSNTSRLFVVALDRSQCSMKCLDAAAMLMKPSDRLEILHIFNRHISEVDRTQLTTSYLEKISNLSVAGDVYLQQELDDAPIGELIQDYVAKKSASFLLFGRNGLSTELDTTAASKRRIGSVTKMLLASPRCVLVACP